MHKHWACSKEDKKFGFAGWSGLHQFCQYLASLRIHFSECLRAPALLKVLLVVIPLRIFKVLEVLRTSSDCCWVLRSTSERLMSFEKKALLIFTLHLIILVSSAGSARQASSVMGAQYVLPRRSQGALTPAQIAS